MTWYDKDLVENESDRYQLITYGREACCVVCTIRHLLFHFKCRSFSTCKPVTWETPLRIPRRLLTIEVYLLLYCFFCNCIHLQCLLSCLYHSYLSRYSSLSLSQCDDARPKTAKSASGPVRVTSQPRQARTHRHRFTSEYQVHTSREQSL